MPSNHPLLLDQIVEYARLEPDIEVGGVILTDQKHSMVTKTLVTGDERKVLIPMPTYSSLDKYEFNTVIKFHSHPYAYDWQPRFSGTDKNSFEKAVKYFRSYLDRLIVTGPFHIYNYVVTKFGKFEWQGVDFTLEAEPLIEFSSSTRNNLLKASELINQNSTY